MSATVILKDEARSTLPGSMASLPEALGALPLAPSSSAQSTFS